MKKLILIICFLFGCEIYHGEIQSIYGVMSPIEGRTAIYYLNFDRYNHGHITQFYSEDRITDGLILNAEVIARNFTENVSFKIILTSGVDTIYISPILSTTYKSFYTKIRIGKKLNGLLNVRIFRFEKLRPIDFICQIEYIQ